MRTRLAIVVTSLFLAGVMPFAVSAAELRYPANGEDGDITIGKDEVISDDLYVVGGKVRISGAVKGDVFVAGGEVTIDGPVEGNVNAVGGDIAVNATIGGSLRIVGGQATVFDGATIGRDLIFLGGALETKASSTVGRDLLMTGGDLVSDGTVVRNVLFRGGQVSLAGQTGGWADVGADAIKVVAGSKVAGDLTTRTASEPRIDATSMVGGEYKNELVAKPTRSPVDGVMRGFWKALSLFLIALFLVLVFPKKAEAVVHDFRGKVGKNALVGLAAFFLTVPAAVIILITMIGAPFAIALMFVWIVALYAAAAYLAIFVGQLIRKTFAKDRPLGWYDAAIGAVALWLVAMVPALGGLVELAFLIYSLGVMVRVDAALLRIVRGTELVNHG